MAIKKAYRTRVPIQKRQERIAKIQKKKPASKIHTKDKKTLIIAQEIKFARLLANNDKKVRDKVLKNLRRWLTIRAQSSFAFTETDFMRLWKGLFYCMWMSDKPLIQEELSESLSQIVHCLESIDTVLLYTKCALKTLATEWFGIDNYRLDKFAMLVRRIFRQTFVVCKKRSWAKDWVVGIADTLEKLLLDPKSSRGFIMHVAHLYLEELGKIGDGTIPENTVTEFVKPFAAYMTGLDDEKEIKYIMRHIFRYLIFQSDVGLDYAEKFEAWWRAGFPCRSIHEIEKVEVSEDDTGEECDEDDEKEAQYSNNGEKPLDPRAGKVDVELPEIRFNALGIAELLKLYRFHPMSTSKSRRQLAHLIKEFTEVAQGRMPLGIKEINLPKQEREVTNPTKAAMRFLQFEEELYSDASKAKRKRKRNGQIENVDKSSTNDTVQDECDAVNLSDRLNSETSKISKENLKKRQQKDNTMENGPVKSKKMKLDKMSNCKQNKKIKVKQNGLGRDTEKSPRLKKSKKRDSCGSWDISDSADTPSKFISNENENVLITVEDISTPTKTTLAKDLLSDQVMWLTPVLTKLEDEKTKMKKYMKTEIEQESQTNLKKRVKIVLHRNTAQNTSEYMQQIRQSPAIPFDANKKPLASVLKASAIPSPVNPFYKKK